jgi:hypothetical protein
MSELTAIGLDLAKNVFQVHRIDAEGKIIARRQLHRGGVLKFFKGLSPCLVGLEACGTAQHWAREIAALGHTVRLMPSPYAKPMTSAARQMQRMRKQSARRPPRPPCTSWPAAQGTAGGRDHRSLRLWADTPEGRILVHGLWEKDPCRPDEVKMTMPQIAPQYLPTAEPCEF